MSAVLRAAAAVATMLATSAHADVVSVAESADGARILLHDTKGPCVGRAHNAEYMDRQGVRVAGCWTAAGATVFVVFFDGDTARVPIAAFRPPKQL